MDGARLDGDGPSHDREWFEGAFAAHYDDILGYAARRVGVDEAGEVAAEAFLIAWRRRDDYSHDDVRLWLFGTARRIVANAGRSRERAGRLVELLARQPARLVDDPAEAVATRMQVLEALLSLPFGQAEAVRLIEWDGFTLAEAAAVAGCSAATFRVRLHRARRRMAVLLADATAPGGEPLVTNERTESR